MSDAQPPENLAQSPVDIAALRARLGSPGKPISQAELARRCSVAASTICRYEENADVQQGPLLVLLQKLDEESRQERAA